MNIKNFERAVPANEAIEIAKKWADKNKLILESSVVDSVTCVNGITTGACLKDELGRVLSRSSGKGVGEQSIASGMFEAIEHAATNFVIPGQVPIEYIGELPVNSEIEQLDLCYRLAREMADGSKQELLDFYPIEVGLTLAHSGVIVYPRIVCDISCPISQDTGSVAPLSVYSNSTGTAAGVGTADAILHGLNEVIERDAESKFLLDVNMGMQSYKAVYPDEGPWEEYFNQITKGYGKGGALLLLESVAGYVFCAVSSPRNGEGQIGVGSSQDPRIAMVRALTELRQYQVATEEGASWEDDGGLPVSELSKYPNMAKIATKIFDVPLQPEINFSFILKEAEGKISNPVSELLESGYVPYGRVVWAESEDDDSICVAQALVPGLEYYSNIVYCRPMLPTGRCRSVEVNRFLLSSNAV